MLIQALQPRRRVGGIADDAVEETAAAAGVSDIDIAIVKSDARGEVPRSVSLRELLDDVADFDRGVHSLAASRGRANRGNPGAHDHVGTKLHHIDTMTLEYPSESFEIFIHKHGQFARRFGFRERDKVGHIRRQARSEYDSVQRRGIDPGLAQIPYDVLRKVIADGLGQAPLFAPLEQVLAHQADQSAPAVAERTPASRAAARHRRR